MPSSPPRLCRCGGKVREGVCDKCGPKRRAAHSKKTSERGYGWDWQQFVANVLRSEMPLCADCLEHGIVRAAEEYHHKVKIKDDPTRKLDIENIVGLCDACHNARTAKGE